MIALPKTRQTLMNERSPKQSAQNKTRAQRRDGFTWRSHLLGSVWRKLNTGIQIRKCDLRNFPLSIFPMNAADFLRKTPSVTSTSQSIPSSLEMDVRHFTCIPRDILCHSFPSERMSN
ncbi:hypothetical protein CDAR_399191 [Caerostris darwini]|uniref:Uncharacterized protein n=1 Tax=Caerostris darwini TaxID=1538125 RepID=A0AAV4SXL2_9ARAC|nr:hypothetical protein CDAR_399191 [Caerostris darwini]